MKLAYFPNQIALNAPPVLDAFLQGSRAHGLCPVQEHWDADMAVIWSQVWAGRMRKNQLVWQHYRRLNRPVFVLEVGSLKRHTTWKLGINGVNRAANFGPMGQGPERLQSLELDIRPWRYQGDNILICLQRADSQQWTGQPDLEIWVSSLISQIRRHTSRPIVIRPHPRFRFNRSWPGITVSQPNRIIDSYDSYDFDTALDQAWAVVNWNSGPGIQAIMQGVPGFVGADSLAAPVGNLNIDAIEQPLRPDRQQWLNDLAYTEWTLDEIAQGIPLQRLL